MNTKCTVTEDNNNSCANQASGWASVIVNDDGSWGPGCDSNYETGEAGRIFLCSQHIKEFQIEQPGCPITKQN